MGLKTKMNPFTGKLQYVVDEDTIQTISFKESVDTEASLPPTGNTKNDGRFTNDTGHLYIWSGSAWIDQGDIIDLEWDAITGGPTSTPAEIDDAVAKKHTQNSDTILDEGGSNEISAEDVVKGAIEFIIDGSGSEISTGIAGDIQVPFDCTIQEVTLLGDQSGSIIVDIWKDTYANFAPTDADSITASAVPTITTAIKSTDATLTGWTTSVVAGDVLRFNVDSVTTIERCTIILKIKKV